MTANTIVSTSQFYVNLQLCYDTVCQQVEVPWVPSFQVVPKDTYVCVLTGTIGEHLAGMYYKTPAGVWVLALSYDEICTSLVGASVVKLIVDAVTTQTPPSDNIVYRSGYQLPAGSSITGGTSALWVVVVPSAGGGVSPSSTITLTDLQGNVIGNFLVA